MKKLYYSVCSLGHPHMGVVLEKVMEDKNEGNDVVLAYCNGVLPSCDFNINGNKGFCNLCHYMYNNIKNEYLNGVKVIPVGKKNSGKKQEKYEFSRLEDLRKIKYRDINIGMSLLSYYISWTREMEGVMTKEQYQYFDTLLTDLEQFVDIAYDLIEKEQPDSIVVYNGKLYENRLFYDIATIKGIYFECLEVVGGPLWHEEKFYRTQYDNGLPQNIHNYQTQMDKVWNDTSRTLDEKIELGSSFYYKRRTGQPAADIIFTKNMVDNLLPDDYDKTKKNIVIFNSSDDEKAALGGEWEEGRLFPSQYEAIEFVVQQAPDNAHVYLRIHPNLSKIKYSYHTDLYKLRKYTNLTIIEPTSPINSYALMDIADQVVVFGSAMGVEGCFWGKPVLLLWKALYSELDTCYVPKTKDELKTMLHSELKPKDKINSIKYGLFNLDRRVRVLEDKYIDINYRKVKVFGKEFQILDYMKIWKSKILYAIIISFWGPRLIFRWSKCKIRFPKPIVKGSQDAS